MTSTQKALIRAVLVVCILGSLPRKCTCLPSLLTESTQLKSTDWATSTHVTFTNRSSRNVVTLCLNYDGEPVKHHELGPGESYTQQTYVTHPWIVVETDSGRYRLMELNDWPVFFPQKSGTSVDITDPGDTCNVIDNNLAQEYHYVVA